MAKATADMRETLMQTARATVQAHGYSALSFRELAKEVGIKSSSVHYYFPTKGDLGAALARRYTEEGGQYLDRLLEQGSAQVSPNMAGDRTGDSTGDKTPDTAGQTAGDGAKTGNRPADPSWYIDRYVDIFRAALQNNNRMCLCGIMSAEYDILPQQVRSEIDAFTQVNIDWLAKIVAIADAQPRPATGSPATDQPASAKNRAAAIFAAIEGAQLVARGSNDIAVYDNAIRIYRQAGLIP